METRWVCEKCGRSATINHEADVWVGEFFSFIIRNHNLVSPECELDNAPIHIHLKEDEG